MTLPKCIRVYKAPSRIMSYDPPPTQCNEYTVLLHLAGSTLSQSRCLSLLLAISSRVSLLFLHVAIDLRPPTVSNHTSAFNTVALQSPDMFNARMSLGTQLVHSLSFSPRPLHTAPSRLPNMLRFGNRPLLIRVSGPAHKRLLVRNVSSMF